MVVPSDSRAKGPQLSLAFSTNTSALLWWISVIISDEFEDILSQALHVFLCCKRTFSKIFGFFQPPDSVLATLEFSKVLLDTESE